MLSHISYSQVNQFRNCPRSWFVTKILGESQPPSDKAQRGSDFDASVAAALGLGSKPDHPVSDEVVGAVNWYLEQPGAWTKADAAQQEIRITRNAWDALREMHDVAYDLPWPIVGYIDLSRRMSDGIRRELLDLKTSERMDWRPEWAIQTSLYALAEGASQWHVHLIAFNKSGLKMRQYTYRPTPSTFRWVMNTIGSLAQGMYAASQAKSAEWLAATPGYWCSFCPRNLSCEGAALGSLAYTES